MRKFSTHTTHFLPKLEQCLRACTKIDRKQRTARESCESFESSPKSPSFSLIHWKFSCSSSVCEQIRESSVDLFSSAEKTVRRRKTRKIQLHFPPLLISHSPPILVWYFPCVLRSALEKILTTKMWHKCGKVENFQSEKNSVEEKFSLGRNFPGKKSFSSATWKGLIFHELKKLSWKSRVVSNVNKNISFEFSGGKFGKFWWKLLKSVQKVFLMSFHGKLRQIQQLFIEKIENSCSGISLETCCEFPPLSVCVSLRVCAWICSCIAVSSFSSFDNFSQFLQARKFPWFYLQIFPSRF